MDPLFRPDAEVSGRLQPGVRRLMPGFFPFDMAVHPFAAVARLLD